MAPSRTSAALLVALALAWPAGCRRGDDAKAGASAPAEAKEGEKSEKPAGHDRIKLTKEAAGENGVKVEAVGKRALVPRLSAAARVAFNAEATARVGAPVAGRVAGIKARPGDAVKEGDELVVVESTELGEAQGDYLQKRAAVAAAEASAEAAKVSFERGKSLLEGGQGVARGEVEKRMADWRAAQAAAKSAAAAASSARSRLKLLGLSDEAVAKLVETGDVRPRYAVRAPIAGRVINLNVTPGALVGPDKDVLLDLADLTSVWVVADVPEPRVGRVRPGAAARVATSAAEEGVKGKVSFVSPTVDPATRTVAVRIAVPNESGALRPGMFARAEIEEATDPPPQPALSVPDDAVQTVEGKTVVFVPVEGEEDTYAARPVKVGEPVGGWDPVLAGLKEGEKVVTAGAFVLKAEMSKPEEEE